MKDSYRLAAGLLLCSLLLPTTSAFSQTNYMEPLGAPGSEAARMKTLNQVEPRTVITRLPFDITNSGSYYISGQLFGCANSNGITIYTNHVRIDLCGFPIIGVPGSLNGICVAAPAFNISVRNGIVSGWGRFGVNATNSKEVVFCEMKAFMNGFGGLYAGENAMVERCSAYNNGYDSGAQGQQPPATDGIQVGAFSSILDCKSRFNKGAGINTFDFSRVVGCTATENMEAQGIMAHDFCTIRDCVAAKNGVDGIFVGNACRVSGNTCVWNSTASTNGAGITVQGLHSLVEDNILIQNTNGIKVVAGGNIVIRNYASFNGMGMDFNIVSQSPKGRVVNAPDGQSFFLQGTDIITNNPWANFKF